MREVKARGFDDIADRLVRGTDTVGLVLSEETTTTSVRSRIFARLIPAAAIAAAVGALFLGTWLFLGAGPSPKAGKRPPISVASVTNDIGAGLEDRNDASPAFIDAPAPRRQAQDAEARPRPAGGSSSASGKSTQVAAALPEASTPDTGADSQLKKVMLDAESASETAKAGATKPKPAAPVKSKRRSKPTSSKRKSASKPKSKSTTASKPKSLARASPPSPVRKNPRELEVERLLRLGRLRFQEGKLLAPPRDNALFYRDEVLALDPGNQGARYLGIEMVASYTELAESELAQGNYFDATRHIENGLRIDPGNERLLWLKENALKKSARGFFDNFRRSLGKSEPKAKQTPTVRPDN